MGADWVMSAIVGAAGLAPTLAAARTGAVIALANKESLVCAGPALLAHRPRGRRRGDPGRFRAFGDLPGARSAIASTRSRA